MQQGVVFLSCGQLTDKFSTAGLNPGRFIFLLKKQALAASLGALHELAVDAGTLQQSNEGK
jgi:hypothetical protein